MRINRIPQALRKRKMCELAKEHTEKEMAKEENANKKARMRYETSVPPIRNARANLHT